MMPLPNRNKVRVAFLLDSDLVSLLKTYEIDEQSDLLNILLINYFSEKQLFSESYQIEYNLLQLKERAEDDIKYLKNENDIKRKQDFIKRINDQIEWMQEFHIDQRTIYLDKDVNMAFNILNKRAERFGYSLGVINRLCKSEIKTILEEYPDFNINKYIHQLNISSRER